MVYDFYDLGFVLKVELIGFVIKLDVVCEGKRGLKMIFCFGLNNWEMVLLFNEIEKIRGVVRFGEWWVRSGKMRKIRSFV